MLSDYIQKAEAGVGSLESVVGRRYPLKMQRRSFLAAPLGAFQLAAAAPDRRVYAFGDGIPHSPEEYGRLLAGLKIEPDDYSRGGVVEKLETRMAALLGKEAAVWMPTGTLANHFAVRLLAGSKRRVLVQAESHLFNDCGDCCQTLSGLDPDSARSRKIYFYTR